LSAYVPPLPPALPLDAHKGIAGRVLCVCGSADMPGAAVLVARAAQRGGAGLVTVFCRDSSSKSILPVAAPEAVLLGGEHVGWEERDDHAVVLGPGLSNDAWTRSALEGAVSSARVPLVLDADALNALRHELELLRTRRHPTVITPHPGEAARLLARAIPSDAAGRVHAARELSARSGAICCLKGARSVVALGERVYVNTTGNPGMATAGSGDVLAGMLGAFLASTLTLPSERWTAYDAVCSAVRLHGLAGDRAVEARGQRGLIASDLIEHLPGVLNAPPP
jgi:hydroxyethylthiazole kinase-like uncharacterized protein yjeF